MGKRGQASLFIILGILLLALVVTLIVAWHIRFDTDQVAHQRMLSSIPAELEPLREYIQKCLYDVSLQGLQKAAAQGGYIDPQSFGITASYVDSTDAEALLFSSKADFMIPYWYYLDSPNDCRENCYFHTWRPQLSGEMRSSVESQLKAYLEEQLPVCLDNFEALRDRGFDIAREEEMEFDIALAEEDVGIYLSYPLYVQTDDTEMVVSDYQAIVDVPFKQMYDYATLIAAAAERYHFLERHTIELVSVFSGLDEKKLPPFSATTFEFVPSLFWIRSEVQDQMRNLLMSYVPGLMLRNAKNYRPRKYEGDVAARKAVQRIYDNMVLPIENPGYGNLDVTFEYLG